MDPPNLPLLLLLTFASTINAQDLFPAPNCGSTGNFIANSTYQSTYQTSLTTLLYSNSTTNSQSLTYGFFNDSATISGTSQTLYIVGSCRGDLTTESCRTCLNASASDIRRLCSLQKVAVLYDENCTVRYSNASIFGTVVTNPVLLLYNPNNVSSQVTYKLGTQVEGLQGEAAGGGSLRKYVIRIVSVEPNMIFAMAQCTPDLTRQQCINRLEKVVRSITDCCLGKAGMRSMAPSCQFRYETYQFFNPVGEPLPPPPPRRPLGARKKQQIYRDMILLFFTCCFLQRKGKKTNGFVQGKSGANELTTMESLQFDLATVQAAANNFSHENKLGEGGFGEVFQGILPNGQQIAVKRLSQSSRQDDEEFKNEVLLVAKLQHRNLVRLLGFCLEGDEKLLAYEFVPNKSLDYFLFGATCQHIHNEFWCNDAYPQKSGQLNWPLRYKIVFVIARGMLYLHEDSRLRIIQRDLKCRNILLDSEMNPKISDFGMARIFGVNQTQASTTKIVGTFGYMSPEYAMHGEFSVKSDVYSFGILLLETICGKKNNFFHQLGGGEYLASYFCEDFAELFLQALESMERGQALGSVGPSYHGFIFKRGSASMPTHLLTLHSGRSDY